MNHKVKLAAIFASLFILNLPLTISRGQGTAFSYQGMLNSGGATANGSYDIQFILFATNVTGIAMAGPVTNSAVAVSNGLFTTTVNFGNVFTGSSNWLQIAVSTNGANDFTTLSPRQRLTPVPYAITAANISGTVSASSISGTVPLARLPASLVTNGETGVSITVTSLSVTTTNQIAPLTVPPRIPNAVVGQVTGLNAPYSVAMGGRYAYVVNYSGSSMSVIDVSDPTNPATIDSLTGLNFPYCVAVAGRYAYVGNDGGGSLSVIDVSNPSNPVIVGTVTGLTFPESVAVAGRYAYVADNAGLFAVVDVSNPTNPATISTLTGFNEPSSVAVAGRYAYMVNMGGDSLSVIDVSNPSSPAVVGTLTGLSNPSSVAVVGRYAYVANNGGGSLSVIDVSIPSSPVVAGTATGINAPTFAVVSGRYAYAISSSTLSVIDVNNPSSPTTVGTWTTANDFVSMAVQGRYAYAGNDEANTLSVIDLGGAYIQQLEAGTIETGTLQTRDTATVGNNLDVRGGLTVSASARITGGLSVDGLSVNGTKISSGITTNILTSSVGGHTLYITNGIIMRVQ